MATTVLTGCTNNGVIETMDERLKKLVMEAQQQTSQTQMRQNALTQLVDEILRSRKICRQGCQPLSGIYLEIYQQLQEQLLLDVDQELNKYNEKRTSVREWANILRNNALKKVLDDSQLKKLALEAQRHPVYTEARQQALIELVNAIVLSGRLCHPHRGILPYSSYELIYEEAVNQTLVYICQEIDKYDPDRKEQKFMNWVNFRLDKMVLDSYLKFKRQADREIPTLSDLDNMAQPEFQNNSIDTLIECIEEDVSNKFKNEHIRNFPEANFRTVVLATFSGKSWKEISTELGIGIPTLSSFFRRSCQKFAPQLQEYL